MPSLKREEEYTINKNRYEAMQKNFRKSFLIAMIPSAGIWLVLMLYYFIRGLALLAGASMIIGQKYANEVTGRNDKTGLGYDQPHLYMTFLFAIALLIFLSFLLKNKKPLYATFFLYGAGAIYGFIALITGSLDFVEGMYFIAYGAFGAWISDYIIRLYKENDYLSKQEGYPDFIIAIDEPRPMANTSGLYYKQSEYLKRQQKEKKESGEADSEATSWEMEDLALDAQLPKGNRKIDNMM